MKRSGRCGFEPHSKRQDAASTEVFRVKKDNLWQAQFRCAVEQTPSFHVTDT